MLKETLFTNDQRLILVDLHTHGAETAPRLLAKLGQEMLDHLIQTGCVSPLPSPLGPLYQLGPNGRRQLGLCPYYKSPPEAAATQVIRRRVVEQLEAESHTYLGKAARNLMLFGSPPFYVAARYGGYSARSIRRVLQQLTPELIAQGTYLLVYTRYTQRAPKTRSNKLLRLRKLPLEEGTACY